MPVQGQHVTDSSLLRFGAARSLSPEPFSEVGSPYGGKVAPDGQLIAIFASARHGSWAGRVRPRARIGSDRLTLFNAALSTSLGTCDGVRYTIQDAAFHPTLPWMAVATGNFDGGYFYEGETLLWNWRTGERRSLFAPSRFALRCRFDNAHTLTVLFTQATDEDDEGHFCITVQEVLRWSERGPIEINPSECEPNALGFGDLGPSWPEQADTWSVLPRLAAASFRPSFGVWDIAWWSDAELAVAATQPVLAVHGLTDGKVRRHEHPKGKGVQLLRDRDGVNLLHVFTQKGHAENEGRSHLMVASRDGLTPWQEFDRAYLFSIGRDGALLGRATGNFPDVTLTGQRTRLISMGLGHFDTSNHALHVRGSRQQYFLAGEAPAPWSGKWLWRLGELGPEKCMNWDADGQRMDSLAVVCQGEQTFIRASHRYHSSEVFAHWFVDSFDVSAGWDKRWTWTATGPVTALAAATSGQPWVAVGTADSTVWLLNAVTGAVLDRQTLGDGRTDVVPTAMDVSPTGRQLAVGSADGRVWVIDLRST